ncbi:MAG: hypothetical protein SFW09_23190 [Hyphomicrobiaceae bacterium]|nr:hypothetical protein [Hyphomicrobiaceae bacterium]
MSELDPKAVYATMQEDARRGPLSKTLLAARAIAIAAAVGGAIPTAMTVYQSWAHGIPYNEVTHRLKQYDIWVRNFECKIDYRALTTAQGTRVDAGACGKTGDIAIKVTAPNGKAAYEWIAFAQLQKQGQASLWPHLVGAAMAADGTPRGDGRPDVAGGASASDGRIAPPPLGPLLHRTQATPPGAGASSAGGMKVICEAMPAKGILLRVVQEGTKCYRERVALFRGSVETREEVACTTTCK